MQEPENTPEKPLGPLPLWINIYQAAAWVSFRTDRALITLDRPSLLHAEIRYSGIPQVDTLDDFRSPLQKGRPVAQGAAGKDGPYVDIPPVTWVTIDPAPLYPEMMPYPHVQMRRDVLVKAFPTLETLAKRRQRPQRKASQSEVLHWFNGLRKQDRNAAQSWLYRRAKIDLPDVWVIHDQIRALTPDRKRGPKSNVKKSAS